MDFPPPPTAEELAAIRQRLIDAGDTRDWTDLCDEEEQHSLDRAEIQGGK